MHAQLKPAKARSATSARGAKHAEEGGTRAAVCGAQPAKSKGSPECFVGPDAGLKDREPNDHAVPALTQQQRALQRGVAVLDRFEGRRAVPRVCGGRRQRIERPVLCGRLPSVGGSASLGPAASSGGAEVLQNHFRKQARRQVLPIAKQHPHL